MWFRLCQQSHFKLQNESFLYQISISVQIEKQFKIHVKVYYSLRIFDIVYQSHMTLNIKLKWDWNFSQFWYNFYAILAQFLTWNSIREHWFLVFLLQITNFKFSIGKFLKFKFSVSACFKFVDELKKQLQIHLLSKHKT